MTAEELDPTFMLPISTSALSDVLGISVQRIGQLVKSQILTRRCDSHFDCLPAIKSYCKYISGVAARRAPNPSLNKSLLKQRIRLAREQADQIQRNNLIGNGSVAVVADISLVFGEQCSRC